MLFPVFRVLTHALHLGQWFTQSRTDLDPDLISPFLESKMLQVLVSGIQCGAKRIRRSFMCKSPRLSQILLKLFAMTCALLISPSFALATERDSILNNGAPHVASWAYYTDPGDRWYISEVKAGKVAVYSLGPIVNHNAGWWTVGDGVATVNAASNRVAIDPNIDLNSSSTFYDVGLRQWLTDASIHSDRQKIQGTNVPIKWFFFNAPNGSWYIVNAPGYGSATQILKFSELNGAYDWKATDTADFVPVFSSSGNGGWNVGFRTSTTSDDHGNSIGTATVIAANSSTAGSIEVAGDNDYFRINVSGSGTLTVNTTGATDTYGYLLDSNGQELKPDDDSGGSGNFRISQPVSAGTYYVRVKNFYSDRTGTYTLVSQLASAPLPTKVVLLLHGMNSGPETWNDLVASRWGGSCISIYNGALYQDPISVDASGAVCYRVKFGRLDINGLTGLESMTCGVDSRSTGQGCQGDYSRIFNNGVNDLGTEVKLAVAAIRTRWSNNAQVVLLGHSRGGLAARAFLQVAVSDPDISAIKGLITTGTPHMGSPLGRIYKRLKDSCSTNAGATRNTAPAGCLDDWQAVDCLRQVNTTAVCRQFPAKMDNRTPTIDLLSPESADVVALNQTKQILIGHNIFFKRLAYQGESLGHLATGYSAWNIPWVPQGGEQFSDQSKQWVLCQSYTCTKSENSSEFLGDGIVPYASQAVTDIAGSLTTISGGSVYHTDEPKRVSDLNDALNGSSGSSGSW